MAHNHQGKKDYGLRVAAKILSKGFIAIVRVTPLGKVHLHFDWDKDEYADTMKQARNTKHTNKEFK